MAAYYDFLKKKEDDEQQPQSQSSTSSKQSVWNDGYNFGDVYRTVSSTSSDLMTTIASGALKATEGLVDAVASVGGTIGKWIGDWTGLYDSKIVEENVRNFVKTDYTDRLYTQNMRKLTDTLAGVGSNSTASLFDTTGSVGSTTKGITESVGFMLPIIALNVAAPGVGTAATTALFGTSAGGAATQGAFQEGYTDLPTATAYGALSGVSEGLIETISGGIGGVTGKNAAKTGAKVALKDVAGEGAEEVASGLLDPILRKLTLERENSDYNPLNEIKNYFTSGDWGQDFLGGTLASGALKGGQAFSRYNNYGRAGVRAQNNLVELSNINEQAMEVERDILSAQSRLARETDTTKKAKLQRELSKLQSQESELKTRATRYIEQHNQIVDEMMQEENSNERFNRYIEDNALSFNQQQRITENYAQATLERTMGKREATRNTRFVNGSEVLEDGVRGVYENGEIVADQATIEEGTVSQTLSHELMHALSDKTRTNLVDIVVEEKRRNGTYESDLERYRELYGDDINIINEEMTADFISENYLNDFDALDSILSKNDSISSRVKYGLKRFFNMERGSERDIKNRVLKLVDKGLNEAPSTRSEPMYKRSSNVNYEKQEGKPTEVTVITTDKNNTSSNAIKAESVSHGAKTSIGRNTQNMIKRVEVKYRGTLDAQQLSTYRGLVEISNSVAQQLFNIDNADRLNTILENNSKLGKNGEYMIQIHEIANIDKKFTDSKFQKLAEDIVFKSVTINGLTMDKFMSKADISTIRQAIKNTIRDGNGFHVRDTLVTEINKLQIKVQETITKSKQVAKISDITRKLRTFTNKAAKNGTASAALPIMKVVANLDSSRGMVQAISTNGDNVRKQIRGLYQTYMNSEDNLTTLRENTGIDIPQDVYEAFKSFNDNEHNGKVLSNSEIRNLEVIAIWANSLKNFNKVTIAERTLDTKETVTEFGNRAQVHAKVFVKSGNKFINFFKRFFARYTNRRNIFKLMGLDDIYNDIYQGQNETFRYQQKYIDIMKDTFDKDAVKTLAGKYKLGDTEISNDSALMLYLTAKDPKGFESLTAKEFYIVADGKRKVHAPLTVAEYDALVEHVEGNKSLSGCVTAFREFMSVAWADTQATQEQIYGFANEGADTTTYAPLHASRDSFSRNPFSGNNTGLFAVNRAGFVQERTKKPTSLDINGFLSEVQRGITARANYNALAVLAHNLNKIINTKGTNGRTLIGMTNDFTNALGQDLSLESVLTTTFNEVQNIREPAKSVEKAAAQLRKAAAVSSLGLNPKVMFSQMSSYFLAFSELNPADLIHGTTGFASTKLTKEMLDNSPMLRHRYESGGIMQSMTNNFSNVHSFTGAYNKITSFFTAGITTFDRRTLTAIYSAAKSKFEKQGLSGQELIDKAIKLTEQICSETQPSTTILDKPIGISNGGELARTLNMFTSQTYQTLSMLYSAMQDIYLANQLTRHPELAQQLSMTPEDVKALSKAAKTKLAKTGTSVVMSTLVYTLIGLAFKYLMGKNDDEDTALDVLKDTGIDFLANGTISLIPYARDLYTTLYKGYDYEPSALSTLNDAIDGVQATFTTIDKLISNKNVNIGNAAWDIASGLSPILGLPTRNLYNVIYGITNWFDPALAIEIKDATYGLTSTSYSQTYARLVKEGDTTSANKVLNSYFENYKGGSISEKSNKIITTLYSKGKTGVMPRSIPTSVDVNGNSVTLNRAQTAKFKEIYSKASSEIDKLINSSAFSRMNDDAKASAIKALYDTYYDKAKQDVLGVTITSKNVKFAELLGNKFVGLLSYASYAKKLTASDKSSKSELVHDYIDNLPLSSNDKTLLLLMSGYTASDAMISDLQSQYSKSRLESIL